MESPIGIATSYVLKLSTIKSYLIIILVGMPYQSMIHLQLPVAMATALKIRISFKLVILFLA